ncbi:unnamed protein product [Adineta steineri]|uniref:Uncharacterized protein n=2 Tax=Adineta steineri TaxID=433720 RepID=A0A818MXD9_9BILA|nr:unnamed protein product [Adineta steineri]CAF3595888.1 unnamed protein product [Adineta steineri]
MKLVALVAGIILAVTCIFYIASNALPSWGQLTVEGETGAYGLWKICGSGPGVKECISIKCPAATGDSSFCSKILAGRAFITLACILSGITTIFLFICAVIDEKISRILSLAAKVLAFVCVIMGIIGVGTGGSTLKTLSVGDFKFSFGAAFIIGIVAIIINLVGAITSIFIKQSST